MASDVKWIKITTDIFDDEKILLIENLPDSYAIITVWFKLLCLAGKQNNSGVFMMGRVAYTDKMLATIFRMKEATVTMALNIFEDFGMIEIIGGVITIPNWGKHQNLDQLESKKEYMREYMREYREKQKAITSGKSSCKTNSKANVSSLDKDIDKDIEIDIDKENDNDDSYHESLHESSKQSKRFTPPTVQQVADYCIERMNKVSPKRFVDYYTSNGWMVGRTKMKDWKAAVRNWERSETSGKKNVKFDERSYTNEELDAKINDPLAELLGEM